jgi:hypothetical protein
MDNLYDLLKKFYGDLEPIKLNNGSELDLRDIIAGVYDKIYNKLIKKDTVILKQWGEKISKIPIEQRSEYGKIDNDVENFGILERLLNEKLYKPLYGDDFQNELVEQIFLFDEPEKFFKRFIRFSMIIMENDSNSLPEEDFKFWLTAVKNFFIDFYEIPEKKFHDVPLNDTGKFNVGGIIIFFILFILLPFIAFNIGLAMLIYIIGIIIVIFILVFKGVKGEKVFKLLSLKYILQSWYYIFKQI